MANPVLRRVAKIGDGWLPQGSPTDENKLNFERLNQYLESNNRSMEDIGIEGRISLNMTNTEIQKSFFAWGQLGATHVSVNTMNLGLQFPQEHLESLSNFIEMAKDS